MTEAFANLARTAAEARGCGSLPVVVLPHPMEGRPREEIERIARERLDEIVSALLAPADPGAEPRSS
ncbi:hypothetical protein KGQ64_16495 [bacterium]|nr:hypothetical protein [bacterium]